MRTESLEVPGGMLAYDIRVPEAESGARTLLLLAAPMDASGFTTLAQHFRDRTVVTYVRSPSRSGWGRKR